MAIGALEIQLLADVARLRQDMQKATGIVGDAAGGMTRAFGSVKAALAGLGIGLSAAGIAAWVKGAIDAADETSKLAQKMGVATEEVAGLQLAFELSGTSSQIMTTSIARLSKEMAAGNDAFARMGVEVKNADGTLRSTRDVLGEVADKFAGYADGAQKSALAQELFGKTGAELIPLLNAGADGLAEMDRMAESLGLTIDERTAKSAEQFNDTLSLIGKGTTGIATQIAGELLPTLTGLAGQFLRTMTEGDKLKTIAAGISSVLKGLYVAGLQVVEVFKTVGTTLGGVAAAVAEAITGGPGSFKRAADILRSLKTDIGTSWKQTLEQSKQAWNTTGDAGVQAMVAITRSAAPAEQAIERTARATRKLADETKKVAQATEKWVPMLDETDSALTGVLSDSEMLAYVLASEVAPAMDETAAETQRLANAAKQAGENMAQGAIDAQNSTAEWDRAWQQVSQSMTDALMDGGKNVGRMLQDLFRTLVLRPVLAPIGEAVGSAINPLISGAAGFLKPFAPYLAGAAALFAMKDKILGGEIKDTGAIGTLGFGGMSAEGYDLKTGGLFGNTSSSSRALGPIGDALGAGSAAMYAQVREYARALKLPADAVGAAKLDFQFSTKGLSAEQIQSKVADIVRQYGEAMAAEAGEFLRPFQKAGESLLDTMGRLAEVETFTAELANLGGAFGNIAASSLGARSALVDLMGGIDALGAAASSFVSNYYTQDEQAGIAARSVVTALQAAGIDTSTLATKTDYRLLLESLDPETQTGQIAALLQQADSFAQLADYLASTEQADTLMTLADGAAAQVLMLETLNATSGTGLETVSTAVTTGTEQVVGAINALTEVTQRTLSAVAVYSQRTANVLERVIPDGDALTVRTAT